ncbi:MAG: CotH kinase family protein [Deltaproteobacteria bacterium]|nr:CotH kinase family protein [Deltaproteobacteria bacterium]
MGYAWVSVNDEVYGLYSNVETPDRDYLDRNFGNRDGNLYEGGYPYYPDSYDHADFSTRETRNFELESGSEMDWADVQAVTSALLSDDIDGNLAPIVDMDRYAAFQIAEAWTGQWDGYAFASNNYRVYFDHGQTGKMYMVPTGLDYCFTSYGGNLGTARSPLGQKCQRDASCNERFASVLEPTLDAIDAAELEELMDSTYALIVDYIDDDPRSYVTSRSTARSIETMRTWIRGRSAEVRGWYR